MTRRIGLASGLVACVCICAATLVAQERAASGKKSAATLRQAATKAPVANLSTLAQKPVSTKAQDRKSGLAASDLPAAAPVGHAITAIAPQSGAPHLLSNGLGTNGSPVPHGTCPGAVVVTQTPNAVVAPLFSVACLVGGATNSDNQYARCFSSANLGNGMTLNCVEFGVQVATTADGFGQPATIVLTLNPEGGCPWEGAPQGSGAPSAVQQIVIPDSAISNVVVILDTPFAVGPTDSLLMEILIPAAGANAELFFLGGSSNGQTAPSWFASAGCGLATYIDPVTIGFPDVAYVMSLHGDPLSTGPGVCCDISAVPATCVDAPGGVEDCIGEFLVFTEGGDCATVVCESLTGSCCNEVTGDCAPDVPVLACDGPNDIFTEGGSCDDCVACDPPPELFCDNQEVHLEAEVCGEDVNGACNQDPDGPPEPVNCGDTICGTAWADGGVRDTDWYEFTIFQPSQITVTVNAEFPVAVGIISLFGGCDALEILEFAQDLSLSQTIVSDCLQPGSYILFIAVSQDMNNNGVPCESQCDFGNDYIAELVCGNCPGACCGETCPFECFITTDEVGCNAIFGFSWLGPNTECGVDCFGSSCCKGDGNFDNSIDGRDIVPMIDGIVSFLACIPNGNEPLFCALDMNRDFAIDGADADLLVTALLAGDACPPLSPCETAELVECNSVTIVNLTLNDNPLNPSPSCNTGPDGGVGEQWITFIATDTSALISTCSQTIPTADDSVFGVWSGECGALFEIGCAEDNCGPFLGTVCVTTTPGEQYWINIAAWDVGDQDTYDVTITCPCPGPPENDNCLQRLPIFDGVTAFSTLFATTDGIVHPLCLPGSGQTFADIWYNYVATCTGDLTVSTCNTVDYDSDLVVYTGCETCPPQQADFLGCNDDAAGCAGFSSLVVVPVTDGVCYKIRVGGWDSLLDQGSGDLLISCAAEGLGACCDIATSECLGDLDEVSCLAIGGTTWTEFQSCATFNCPSPGPCGVTTTLAGNNVADGINGISPIGDPPINGWGSTLNPGGGVGIFDDAIMGPGTITGFHFEFIDQTSAIGSLSAFTTYEVRVYDLAGVGCIMGLLDATVAVPIMTFTGTVGGNTTKTLCGGPFFGGDVECIDISVPPTPIGAGCYAVWITLPGAAGGGGGYFLATGGDSPNASSPDSDGVFGLDQAGLNVNGAGSGQHASFCVSGS